MQDLLNTEANDEIDLRELFITLWAYKLLIISFCVLGVIYGGYYSLNARKEYSSTAIFKLGDTSVNMNLSQNISSLANIARLNPMISANTYPVDQVRGRIFIQSLDEKLNFRTDPYFNTYNPNHVDPIWKSRIKRAIGWQKSSINAEEAMWQNIIAKYLKNVELNQTTDGSIKVSVTHVNPQRAAKIANGIMDEIILNKKTKINKTQDQHLSYLSNTLAMALNDLEVSQSKLKEFALKNSALPLEEFAAGSLKLDLLREQLIQTTELHEAVAALSLILKNEKIDQNDYLALRQKFPIIDQVEFRRVLGQNEIISSWSWPEASTVDAVFDTLSDRINRLQSQINASQIDAERSGLALETFAKLEREAKISEATYTVLIEQVKAQSMLTGFRPDKTEIYEYASASINASAPKRSMILVVGAMSGLFAGVLLSLALSTYRGVYYSINSLMIGAQARFTASVKTLLPLRNKILGEVGAIHMKKSHPILRDMAVEIHKNATKQVVVTSSRAKMNGDCVARALAEYMQSDSMKVAVINFSSRAKKLDIEGERLSVGSFVVTESAGHISALRPNEALELLSHKDFWGKINLLNSTFDLVFLCADNSDAISLLSALEGQKVYHITIARTKKTKSSTLIHMRSLLPIQGLLYD
jgi:uncharacterized protein involved in exopolysaccharide biosynthesis